MAYEELNGQVTDDVTLIDLKRSSRDPNRPTPRAQYIENR